MPLLTLAAHRMPPMNHQVLPAVEGAEKRPTGYDRSGGLHLPVCSLGPGAHGLPCKSHQRSCAQQCCHQRHINSLRQSFERQGPHLSSGGASHSWIPTTVLDNSHKMYHAHGLAGPL